MKGKTVLVLALAVCLVLTGVPAAADKVTKKDKAAQAASADQADQEVQQNTLGSRGLTKGSQNSNAPSGAPHVGISREDILEHQNWSRNPNSSTLAKAEELVSVAQGLIADGEHEEATRVLQKVVMMNLSDDRASQKVLAQAGLLLGDAYLEIYADAPEASVKAAGYYSIAVSYLDIDQDFDLVLQTVRTVAEIYHGIDADHAATLDQIVLELESGLRPALDLMPASLTTTSSTGGFTTRDPGDDTCDAAVDVTLPHSEIMTVSFSGDHNWRSYSLAEDSLVRIETLSSSIFGDDTDLTLWGSCDGSTPGNFITFDDDDGPGFLSLIEVCKPAGDYWVEVGGWIDLATPDDFQFSVQAVEPCVLQGADEFEPDNESSQATKIGFRNNGVGEGNQTGRDNSQIQSHTIGPFLAGDVDFVKFGLSRANRVRMETSGDGDTVIGLSSSSGELLLVNDDGGAGLNSKLDVCLPAGSNWFLAMIGFDRLATFEYDIAVDVEFPCNFEAEPNGVCGQAGEITPGPVYSGFQTAAGVAENDYYFFTIDETQFVEIETDGADIFAVDTFLELYDGCPGNLIAADDDAGDGFLSKIGVTLDPGTYYLNVTVSPFSVGANYPYDFTMTFSTPPLAETEPNDSCATANAVFLGDDVLASISPVGDRDHFLLSVPADGFVQIDTDGPSGDTVLQIESANGSTVIGCDDDAGPGLFSSWGCCLPAGDYCVVVRDFGDNGTISSYNVTFSDLGTCTPSNPPVCDVSGLGCPF